MGSDEDGKQLLWIPIAAPFPESWNTAAAAVFDRASRGTGAPAGGFAVQHCMSGRHTTGLATHRRGTLVAWTLQFGLRACEPPLLDAFLASRAIAGILGFPAADPFTGPAFVAQAFEGLATEPSSRLPGALLVASNGGVYSVHGVIGDAYFATGGPLGPLGPPVAPLEHLPTGGPLDLRQRFSHGLVEFRVNGGTTVLARHR